MPQSEEDKEDVSGEDLLLSSKAALLASHFRAYVSKYSSDKVSLLPPT